MRLRRPRRFITLSASTKAVLIAHFWPLLRDGQDPHDLAARMAYHLHRTHNRTTALTRAGITTDKQVASDLVQGRMDVSASDLAFIAQRLGLPEAELSRPLSYQEEEAWTFYRLSARNRLVVWERARSRWRNINMPDIHAAQAMGLSRDGLARVYSARSRLIMRHDHALGLANAMGKTMLPADLIEGLDEPAR
jgi:hypothetical protein